MRYSQCAGHSVTGSLSAWDFALVAAMVVALITPLGAVDEADAPAEAAEEEEDIVRFRSATCVSIFEQLIADETRTEVLRGRISRKRVTQLGLRKDVEVPQ
jgi:hypothetical protein